MLLEGQEGGAENWLPNTEFQENEMKGSRLPSNTGDPFEKLLFFYISFRCAA